MTDPENFIARWARRKREAEDEAKTRVADQACPPADDAHASPNDDARRDDQPRHEGSAVGAPAADATAPTGLAFDLARLPSLESINAETDIRAFLSPGVPPDLARAALRRVWAADPKIRDFVGLAENAWDFNAEAAVAGFGPLEMTDELRRLVSDIVSPKAATGPVEQEAAVIPQTSPLAIESSAEIAVAEAKFLPKSQPNPQLPEEEQRPTRDVLVNRGEELRHCQEDVASHNNDGLNDCKQEPVHRAHGRALPKY